MDQQGCHKRLSLSSSHSRQGAVNVNACGGVRLLPSVGTGLLNVSVRDPVECIRIFEISHNTIATVLKCAA